MIAKLLIFTLFSCQLAYSFTESINEVGEKTKWNRVDKDLFIYVNPDPLSLDGFDSGTSVDEVSGQTVDAFNEAAEEWNSISPYKIRPVFTSNPVNGNYFAYSENSAYFDSGVIALTSLLYSTHTGVISSANIKMNQSISRPLGLTLDKAQSGNTEGYIGDIITHELGHFLGLSHSETVGATMVYSVFKGQYSIHDDDKAGVKSLYNISSNGALKGTVINEGKSGQFGIHVQVISVANNSVVQGQVTDENGEFYFDNLPLDDSYYILISPLRNTDTLPEFYKNVNSNQCNLKSFVPSFYMKCGAGGKSRPQVFELNSEEDFIDVGSVTIRCDENLESQYLVNKFSQIEATQLIADYRKSGEVYNGIFFEDNVENNTPDLFEMDLTYLDPTSMVLNTSVLSAGIGTPIDFIVQIKRSDELNWSTYKTSRDSLDKLNTDFTFQVQLSPIASDNIFQIKVYPVELSSSDTFEIFSSKDLVNDNLIYTITTQVGYNSQGEFVPVKNLSSYPYSDNYFCPEGQSTFVSKGFTPLNKSPFDAGQLGQNSAVGCGTIDTSGGGNRASRVGLSFSLGFLIIVFFNLFAFRRQNSLS